MEEIWKDINLSSVNDINNNRTFPSVIFQDFLAGPFNDAPPTRSSAVYNDTSQLAEETTFFGSLSPSSGTILRLNSGSDPVRSNPAANSRTAVSTPLFGASNNSTFHGFGSPAVVFPSFCRKRAQANNEKPDDCRHKLMMKNRESAARSRARKLAYTNKLELEVAHLQEENAKLRKHQEKLLAAPNQLPKRNSLSRSLTAPF